MNVHEALIWHPENCMYVLRTHDVGLDSSEYFSAIFLGYQGVYS